MMIQYVTGLLCAYHEDGPHWRIPVNGHREGRLADNAIDKSADLAPIFSDLRHCERRGLQINDESAPCKYMIWGTHTASHKAEHNMSYERQHLHDLGHTPLGQS